MGSREDNAVTGGERAKPATWRSYAFGIAAVAVAFGVTAALNPLSDDVLYAPLVGTVVVVSVYYGLWPALAATAVGWVAALALFVEPAGTFEFGMVSDLTPWGVGLVVAVALIWVSRSLQRLREQESRRAEAAEETNVVASELHAFAAALASAVTPGEVAGALLSRVPGMLGSTGGSFGLVEGDALAVVDPAGGPRPALRPGLRLPLETRAPITTAARTGEPAYAVTREQFEREYPDGARLAPYASSALAVPLHVEGRVVGSIGFPFREPDAVDENVLSLARVAAEMGGQALVRSLAYERERTARDGLERVARLVPRFADQPPDRVVQAICNEAREMFEADVAQLWRVADGRLEVLWREPPSLDSPPGSIADPRDYPGMEESLAGLETMFFPDARQTVSGEALERVLADDARSVLRVPIVVAGRAELQLALRWSRVVDEPDAQTLALIRRFADHAGLAIEQGQRRRAEETEQIARARAERLAGDLAQLHALATALGAAATTTEVAALVAERVLAVTGATSTAVYDVGPDGVELLASVGSEAGGREGGGRASARTRSGAVPRSPAWPTPEEDEPRATVPFIVEDEVVGVVIADFRPGHVPDDATRRLVETIAGQAAQPLERARLHEREHAARVQAEISDRRTRRLQRLTASFAGALTPAEVAATFLEETPEVVGATAAALAVLDDEGRELQALRSHGFPDELLGPDGVAPLTSPGPAASAVRLQEPLYRDLDSLLADHPELRETLAGAGLGSFAFLPLSAGAAPVGVAILAWSRPDPISDDERVFIEAVASQCGLALDRARRYEGERVVAETLQRSVLPETVPAMEGARVAALYLPGSTAVDVGGDWFDTLTLPDGRLGFVVGDVVGKGVRAASTMAQLRNGMRALSLDASSPAETMTKLNLLLENYIDVPFATLVYVALDPDTLAATITSAGHPPPLVVEPSGRTMFLEGAGGLPLGVDVTADYEEQEATLEPGSILVLYTDGLVERRGRSIDDGLMQLARAAERAPRDPDAFVDAIVGELLGADARHDDVALLAIFLDPALLAPLRVTIPADPDSLPYLRDELIRWLELAAVSGGDARDIVLATWEAGANAIEHADAGQGALVTVDAALSGDRVRVGVVDRGRWKEPSPRQDRGLGLRLIEALMTSVDVQRRPDGTRIVMERPLTREPARSHGAHPAEH
ncbi:MAG TPA: SpoIIE family protein phosphatase [Gaiella sp.]|nr:SpoIIE family protein phosphatase [Gaiella sp.]